MEKTMDWKEIIKNIENDMNKQILEFGGIKDV